MFKNAVKDFLIWKMIWKTPVAADTPKFAAAGILMKTRRLFQSIYNVLPSPALLHWGVVDW